MCFAVLYGIIQQVEKWCHLKKVFSEQYNYLGLFKKTMKYERKCVTVSGIIGLF